MVTVPLRLMSLWWSLKAREGGLGLAQLEDPKPNLLPLHLNRDPWGSSLSEQEGAQLGSICPFL